MDGGDFDGPQARRSLGSTFLLSLDIVYITIPLFF